MMERTKYIRVTKSNHCPICDKSTWCGVSEDGKIAICMRVESGIPARNGGWAHKLSDEVIKTRPKQVPRPAPTEPEASIEEIYAGYRNVGADGLAQKLGVSEDSLVRLGVRFYCRNYNFPMYNAKHDIIGIKVRDDNGNKFCVPGSKLGIYWPRGVRCTDTTLLFIAEGESDTATLLSIGFDAIGRPSCSGGVEIIRDFLSCKRREVVIMADKDAPGVAGAIKLAEEVVNLTRSIKIITPPHHKDIRGWYREGADKTTIEELIRNTSRCKGMKHETMQNMPQTTDRRQCQQNTTWRTSMHLPNV